MGLDNPLHLMFLLVVLLLVFGAKRLPELGHSLGTGLRGFKEAIGGPGVHESLSTVGQNHSQPQASFVSAQTPSAIVDTQSSAHLAGVQAQAEPAIGEPDDRAA
jgi:sec-independent protein translocase protein TatA